MGPRVEPTRSAPHRLEATVHGRVQGVGFRMFVARAARRLDLSGWVANREDGAVSVMAEGERPSLEVLDGLLRRGPPGASVQRVEVRWAPARGGAIGFEVRHGSHPGD
ncbi:MAG: acylphosphatase [Chloroflexota bacterium]|nr:acylphosphatase [Chloroflexota bacterium]